MIRYADVLSFVVSIVKYESKIRTWTTTIAKEGEQRALDVKAESKDVMATPPTAQIA